MPSSAVMTCEARATVGQVVDELVDRIRTIVEGSALTQSVQTTLAVMGQSATVAPDDEMIDRIVEAAKAQRDVVEVTRTKAFAGSDDAISSSGTFSSAAARAPI